MHCWDLTRKCNTIDVDDEVVVDRVSLTRMRCYEESGKRPKYEKQLERRKIGHELYLGFNVDASNHSSE